MTKSPAIQPQKVSAVSIALVIGIFGVLATIITNWIGLTAYPVPLLLSSIAVVSLFTRKGDENLSWKQQSVVFGVGAVLSIATMLTINSKDSEGIEPPSNAPSKPTDTQASGAPLSTIDDKTLSPTSEPPLETSIDELLDSFAANQISAAKKFSRPIQLSGNVVRVREALGTGILVLISPQSGREHEFGFSAGGTAKLTAINPGDNVTIICPSAGEAMSLVIVRDCSDIKVD